MNMNKCFTFRSTKKIRQPPNAQRAFFNIAPAVLCRSLFCSDKISQFRLIFILFEAVQETLVSQKGVLYFLGLFHSYALKTYEVACSISDFYTWETHSKIMNTLSFERQFELSICDC